MDEISVTDAFDRTELTRIIHSNHRIRHMVQQATNEFLSLQNDLLQRLQKEKFDKTVEDKSKPLIDVLKIQSLNKQVTADKVQLALVGENSSGKTSLIHFLLKSDPFLPADVGSVSARIIRLTYADGIDACLRVYPSISDRHKELVEESLSEYFSTAEPNWSGIKNKIENYVKRPNSEEYEKNSEDNLKILGVFPRVKIISRV